MRYIKINVTFLLPRLILLLFLLTSCSNRKTGNHEYQSSGDTLSQEHSAGGHANSLNTTFRYDGDSVIIPGFIINLHLSDAAERKLKQDRESVIVQAYFSGEPKDTTSEDYLENGELNVGSYRIELLNNRTARFNDVEIAKTSYDALKDKNFEVLINVFSGRHSSDLNILDCDILQNKILSVAGKKSTLNGKLIGEN